MPSVFDLFGELGLKTNELEAGLKRADERLEATDANLNKVIASSERFGDIGAKAGRRYQTFDTSVKVVANRLYALDSQLDKTVSISNRLGDTSATVSRRYEKLGAAIEFQRQRLLANSLAFEKGEISAKQFGNVVASVDKQVASLNSRLRDAAARTTELRETGFTHFQNQIKGAGEGHSLINLNAARPLQGLGPVLQGLGARQFGLDETILNILIVAARQAGIIKVAQEGAAVASTAAAAAETEFSVAASTAAKSQGIVAAESEATAAAMTEASAATTVFGASIVTVGAALAAGTIAILAAYKISEDILASAQKRLKEEEAIEGVLNKQHLILAKIKEDLQDDQRKRDFGAFIQSDDVVAFQRQQDYLQRQLAERQRNIDAADRRKTIGSQAGLTGEALNQYVGTSQLAEETKLQAEQNEQMRELARRRDEIARASAKSSADLVKDAQKEQVDAYKKQLKDTAEANEKANKKAEEDAKKLAERIKNANALILDIAISATDNPYVKIFDQAQKAVEKLKEATKGLHLDISAPYAQIQAQAANAAFKQQLDDKLQAVNYRDLARQFRAGRLDENTPENFQKNLQNKLAALGIGDQSQSIYGKGVNAPWLNWIGQPLAAKSKTLSDAQQHILDQSILQIAGNDPSKLNTNQQKIVADAADREAKKLEDRAKAETKRDALLEENNKQLKTLNENGGMKLVIENNDPDHAKISTRPGKAAPFVYYSKAN